MAIRIRKSRSFVVISIIVGEPTGYRSLLKILAFVMSVVTTVKVDVNCFLFSQLPAQTMLEGSQNKKLRHLLLYLAATRK